MLFYHFPVHIKKSHTELAQKLILRHAARHAQTKKHKLGQTVSTYKKTLKAVVGVKPEHISAYSLILEEGTPFYECYGRKAGEKHKGECEKCLPDEEDEREMYACTKEILFPPAERSDGVPPPKKTEQTLYPDNTSSFLFTKRVFPILMSILWRRFRGRQCLLIRRH